MIFTAEHNVSRYRVLIIIFIVMLGNLLSRNIHGTQVSLSGLDLIEHPKGRTATGSFCGSPKHVSGVGGCMVDSFDGRCLRYAIALAGIALEWAFLI